MRRTIFVFFLFIVCIFSVQSAIQELAVKHERDMCTLVKFERNLSFAEMNS